MLRFYGLILKVCSVSALVFALAAGGLTSPANAGGDISMFSGVGSWIEHWDKNSFDDPLFAVEKLASQKVRTLYLQSGNSSTPKSKDGDLFRPDALRQFIASAHAKGIRVVAWYLPSLEDLQLDFRRIAAAIDFKVFGGRGFDGFALDIESSKVTPSAERSKRLLELARAIRKRVGENYPLGAIIPAPRGIELAEDYWPQFPYKELNSLFDVIMPMSYFTYRTKPHNDSQPSYLGEDGAFNYTSENIAIIRRETDDPEVPIHCLGGVADKVDDNEMKGFIGAITDSEILGASLYNFRFTTDAHWKAWDVLKSNRKAWFLSSRYAGTLPPILEEDELSDFASSSSEGIDRLAKSRVLTQPSSGASNTAITDEW